LTQVSDAQDAGRAPDFFLIGVPRAATTSLYVALRQHPRLFLPQLKEACFACREFDAGLRRTQTRYFHDRAEYLALFAAARADQLIGEGCIYNIYSERAPSEIRALNGDARILVQLRDPVEQMYSNHALKLIMRDIAQDRFADALAAQEGQRAGRLGAPEAMVDYDLRDKATVAPGLARFIDTFGRDRVHVSLVEDFGADPQPVLRSIFTFLGVNAEFQPNVGVHVPNRVARVDRLNRAMGSSRMIGGAKRIVPGFLHPLARSLATAAFRVNRRPAERPLLDLELRERLREEFRPEVERLSGLVGIDLRARWWPDS
jgi:hypothetical protein